MLIYCDAVCEMTRDIFTRLCWWWCIFQPAHTKYVCMRRGRQIQADKDCWLATDATSYAAVMESCDERLCTRLAAAELTGARDSMRPGIPSRRWSSPPIMAEGPPSMAARPPDALEPLRASAQSPDRIKKEDRMPAPSRTYLIKHVVWPHASGQTPEDVAKAYIAQIMPYFA